MKKDIYLWYSACVKSKERKKNVLDQFILLKKLLFDLNKIETDGYKRGNDIIFFLFLQIVNIKKKNEYVILQWNNHILRLTDVYSNDHH